MNGNAGLRPVVGGSHSLRSAPCGKYTKHSRVAGAAAVCAQAVPAGIIASSNGKAIDAPAPFKTVRRDKCFRVRNMLRFSVLASPSLLQRRLALAVLGLPLAECIARHYAEHD